MSDKISILNLLFSGCETPQDVASRIASYIDDYTNLTEEYNKSHSVRYLAQRVFSHAQENDYDMYSEGAILAGAHRETSKSEDDLFVLR